MVLSEEGVAALRAELERVQRETEATRADLERVQRDKEAENREYEAKLDRLRRERSLNTTFDGQGGDNSADRRGTAALTMGPMWTRGVSTGGGLGQRLPYVPRGVVPKFPVECPPYVHIAWERRFEVFIANQDLRHTISPDAPEIAVISCITTHTSLDILARSLSQTTDGYGGTFPKRLLVLPLRVVCRSVTPFRML